MSHRLAPVLLCLTAFACVRAPPRPDAVRPRISEEQAAQLLPPKVKDPGGWARDVLAALDAHQLPADVDTVCQVYAVIEQESGFQANPTVPGLARLVRAELEDKLSALGPLASRALSELLEGRAPGTQDSFEVRLGKVKTEQDVDRLFRDLLAYYQDRFPAPYRAANLLGGLFGSRPEDFNPVTTVGSMQVSVRFSQRLAVEKGREPAGVRDSLYTRAGGVYYGSARLLGHPAAYAQALFRFADYNAGVYSSRNAAIQEQVSKVTGLPLVTDGDLLAYDKQGEVLDKQTHSQRAVLELRARFAPELSESRVRKDLEQEKSAAFEGTDTYRAIKRVWAQKMKADAPYAQVPDVAIKSPKMKQERSTAWFARNVDARYQRCLERDRP